jgi:hypothetical protein
LVAYYKGTELSGSLIDTLGNFNLPIVGSGSVGGDGSSRGTFSTISGAGSQNPDPSAFCLLNSSKSLAALDTDIHPAFMIEVCVTVPVQPSSLYYGCLVKLPRSYYLNLNGWAGKCYFSFANTSGESNPRPTGYDLALGTHYVVAVCLTVGGVNQSRLYINKTAYADQSITKSVASLDNMCIGGNTDSSDSIRVANGIGAARIKEIAIHNNIASFAAAEALMAKRMATADPSVITSYPIL